MTRGNDLSHTTKFAMLVGEYMQDRYHGRFYAKAQNLGRVLKAAYETALEEFDLLLMPTLPLKATKIPAPDCSIVIGGASGLASPISGLWSKKAPTSPAFADSGAPITRRKRGCARSASA